MSIDSKLIEEIGNAAYRYEKQYHGCSQCGLKALQEHLSLGDELTFKAASAFAGGVARMGDMCGALTGGIMAIGLAFGRDKMELMSDQPQWLRAPELSGEFYERFRNEFGSVKCREIQESIFGRYFDFRQAEVREKLFEAAGGYEKCPEVVKKAAQITAEIILRERAKT